MRKGGLREYPIPLKVNQPEILPAKGNYLRVRAALADLIIEIGDNDIYKMAAGEDVAYSVDEEFSQIRVTSLAGVDEIVNIQVGSNVRVTSAKFSGSVSISGNTSNASLKVTDIADPAVTSYNRNGLQAGTNQVVVAAAANVGGLVVHMAECVTANGMSNSGCTGLVAGPTMPTNDFSTILGSHRVLALFKNDLNNGWLKRSVYLPPGEGLYWMNETGTATAHKICSYRLL